MTNNTVAVTNNATSFKQQYDRLRHIAQQINQQDNLDIDQLIPLVEEATTAYKACKARIDQVEQLLAEKIPANAE
jgi:exodeoxyribonuclease VII small subunit